MLVRTRFAPSPTGRLHMGNVRTAVICWCYARKHSGECILRIDDTDVVRSDEALVDAIKSDLAWLGLVFSDSFRQSSRFSRYDEVVSGLRDDGLLYPCYETKEELESARRILLKRGVAPIYRRGRGLGVAADLGADRKPCWRFDIDRASHDKPISWADGIKGRIEFLSHNLSDPIIIREDGSYTYMLPSIIDDIDYQITDVIRGDDHISNTAIQVAMLRAFSVENIKFSHLPLLQSKSSKLSKRAGSEGVDYMRSTGVTTEAIISYLLGLGSSKPQLMSTDIKDHLANFDLANYGSSACLFSMEDLLRTNQHMLQHMTFEQIVSEFADLLVDCGDSELIWSVVRNNIVTVADFVGWHDRILGNFKSPGLDSEEATIVREALNILGSGTWGADFLSDCLSQLKSHFGAKKAMSAVRKALVGVGSGPELMGIMSVMGSAHSLLMMRRSLEG